MALSAAPSPDWHRFSPAAAPDGNRRSVVYGADAPSEAALKLLGNPEGRRILDLGCGRGANAVVLAEAGARVIAVDSSTANVASARELADSAEVRVELHQGNLADLPFLRSDTVDAAISVMALAEVSDLARVFRQVHRVLRPEAPFVCSFPHPAFAMFDPSAPDPLRAVRPYDQSEPITWRLDEASVVDHPRTIGQIFTTLQRASFGIDQLIEVTAEPGSATTPLAAHVPPTLLIRARKQGN